MKKTIVCSLLGLFALPVLEGIAGSPAEFSVQLIGTFDYPGSVTSTQPQKISDNRNIVGLFIGSSGLSSGFVRFKNGTFTPPLVDPNDTSGTTQGRGINRNYQICGDYVDPNTGSYHGFFSKGLGFHDYLVPGSSWTIALGLNNAADFCGSDIPSSGIQSGFVSIGGTVTEFTVPGSTATLAYQINSSNQTAGYYLDSAGVSHGYYRDSDGSFVFPIDPAGSTGTIVFGNNDSNYIVGRYPDVSGVTHGFVFFPPSTYVTYDFPGSTFTSLNGINRSGMIVGRYLDPSSGIEHGFVARLVSASDQNTGGSIPQRHSATEGLGQVVKGVFEEPAF